MLPEATTGRPAQLIFNGTEEQSEFTFCSLDVEDGETIDEDSWVFHVSGGVNTRPENAPHHTLPAGYLDPVKERCTALMTKETFYQKMWDREYHLGPMFQVGHGLQLQSLWRIPTAAVS